MWVNTGEEWINIDEAAVRIEPMGAKCNVLATHPALNRTIKFTGSDANGIVEYILRRRVSSTNDALDAIFKKVEEAQDLTKSNGNGHKRRKRVLRDPEASKRRMSEAALKRWAREREQRGASEAASPT